MANLFDALQQHTSQMPGAPAPQQAQVQASLAAKTGKASTGGSTPHASNIGETAAIEQSKAQGQQIGLQTATAANEVQNQSTALDQQAATFQAGQQAQGREAAQGLATQNTATREQIAGKADNALAQTAAQEGTQVASINANAEQKLKAWATERNISVDDIFADFEASDKELEQRRDAAQLEQAGFLMAMRDKSYVDEIQRVGQERGLQDELAFSEEVNRLTWGNELSDLLDKTSFQSAFNADQRTFERDLAQTDASWALKFAEAAIKDENNKAMIEGGTGLVKAGADGMVKSNTKTSTTTAPSPTSTNPVQSETGYPVMEG